MFQFTLHYVSIRSEGDFFFLSVGPWFLMGAVSLSLKADACSSDMVQTVPAQCS